MSTDRTLWRSEKARLVSLTHRMRAAANDIAAVNAATPRLSVSAPPVANNARISPARKNGTATIAEQPNVERHISIHLYSSVVDSIRSTALRSLRLRASALKKQSALPIGNARVSLRPGLPNRPQQPALHFPCQERLAVSGLPQIEEHGNVQAVLKMHQRRGCAGQRAAMG